MYIFFLYLNRTKRTLNDKHSSIYWNSKLTPARVKVDLLRTKEKNNFLHDRENYGWGRYALEGVTTHDIPGDHYTCFSESNVKELAQVLQNVINRNAKRSPH